MPKLTLGVSEPSRPTAYRVSFYDREYGDLEDVVTLGFAKSSDERTVTEQLTWKVDGVKSVKNQIVVRP